MTEADAVVAQVRPDDLPSFGPARAEVMLACQPHGCFHRFGTAAREQDASE